MTKVLTFSPERQRKSLVMLTEGVVFLDTPEGIEFLDQLEFVIGPVLVGRARKVSVRYTVAEARSLMLHHLLYTPARVDGDKSANVHRLPIKIALAENPWAYLTRCALTWLHQDELGHRGVDLDGDVSPFDQELYLAWSSEPQLTALELVIVKTWEMLSPRTPTELVDPLRDLIEWFGNNPPQRISYEGEAIRAAAHAFRIFTPTQIRAAAAACWGTRPEQRATSIMGGYLNDPSFDPVESDSHLRALRLYGARMRASVGDITRLVGDVA